jgi:hypothetical protein
MSEDEKKIMTLEMHLKKTTIVSNVLAGIISVILALGVGYSFYYNTNSTLDSHTNQIDNMQIIVDDTNKKVNNLSTGEGINHVQIETLEKNVEKIEHNLERVDEKLDRILLQTK